MSETRPIRGMAMINPSRYALIIQAAWSRCVKEILIPGSAMIFVSAVTTTVWSIAVKKTPTHATIMAASAARFPFALPIFFPGVVSFLNELVICLGEKSRGILVVVEDP